MNTTDETLTAREIALSNLECARASLDDLLRRHRGELTRNERAAVKAALRELEGVDR